MTVVLLIPALVIALLIRADDRSSVGATATESSLSGPSTTSLPSTFEIAVTGEILPHPSVVEHARRSAEATGRPHDFAPLFADLRPPLSSADVAICHLEVPVAPPGTELSGYPSFGIPADVADGIAATGWDRCSTASNHSNDRGTAGIVATLDALDRVGVAHSGMARSVDEATSLPIDAIDGVRLAHFSYTWGFNGTPPAETWMVDVIEPARILDDARSARAAGADLVVVSLHWGMEYDTSGSIDQRHLADRLLASPDVDLVVGHGPHVVQPIESMHGKYALLSVGNLVANQGRERPATYDGVVVTTRFTRHGDRWRADPPQVQPTWYDRDAGRVRLVSTALADPQLTALYDQLSESLRRTEAVVGPFLAAG